MKTLKISTFLVLILTIFSLAVLPESFAAADSSTEARIIRFVKEIYSNGDDVRVKLNSLPVQLREKVRVRGINFVKVPDVNGDGICAVEIENPAGRSRTVQVPFRIFTKRQLFVLKQGGQKGDTIGKNDIYVRDTFMNGKGSNYPNSAEDVVGKVLKRDVPANTVITGRYLEDQVVVKRGDMVTIVAENNRMVVQAKGKTIDRGRMGDMVRVKNIASGKELMAKVTGSNTVKVEF